MGLAMGGVSLLHPLDRPLGTPKPHHKEDKFEYHICLGAISLNGCKKKRESLRWERATAGYCQNTSSQTCLSAREAEGLGQVNS